MATHSLSMVVGATPATEALMSGKIAAPGLDLVCHDLATTADAFRRFVREQAFDLCELALVTFLQAREYGKPLILLPITMAARFPLNQILVRADRADIAPTALSGLRIGVRSWTKTTGVWIRAILVDAFGLVPETVRWVSYEDPHVAEYRDPSERAASGQNILRMLLAGEIDVAIGEVSDDSRLRPLFPDPRAAVDGWYRQHGFVPINHMMVATQSVVDASPAIGATLADLIARSRAVAAGPAAAAIDATPLGVEANRPALEWAIDHSLRQGLIRRPVSVDSLFLPFAAPA